MSKNFLQSFCEIFYKKKYRDGYCIYRILFFRFKKRCETPKQIDYSKEKNNNTILVIKNGKSIKNPQFIDNLQITFLGKNNHVEIELPDNSKLSDMFNDTNTITIHGDDCKLLLKKCILTNFVLNMQHNAYCEIGEGTTIGGYFHFANEKDLSLKIGKNCMFSGEVAIWGTDGHIIKDKESGQCINKATNGVEIGDHCWIGHRVTIIKNTILQKDTIVGACSLVKGQFNESNIIIAGNPAKIIKRNVEWDRKPIV